MNKHFFISSKPYSLGLTALLLWVFCLPVAKSYAMKSESTAKLCQRSPSSCLEKVNIELTQVQPKSRIWFSLMQFKLSSLFILQHSDELYQETKRWINDEDLPIPFQVTLYMYYAKSLLSHGDLVEGKRYIYKAKAQLAIMNEVYPSPIKLIEIANLQMFIGELPEAYESLNALKEKYKNSHNPQFMMDLFGHLGHVARQLELYDEALAHWYATVPWSYKYGNEQQIATVHFNLAQAQQHAEQFSLAEKSYLAAIKHAEIALDVVKASHAKLYLAEIKLLGGDKEQAEELLLAINEELLAPNLLLKLNNLKGEL
jgi:tetratricopeptide (TPR) repeat protein